MKPVFEKYNDTILVDNINNEHIVVGIDEFNNPIIVTNEKYHESNYYFSFINNKFTQGNGYGNFQSIKEIIIYYLNKGYKIEVFHQNDWKNALQWLIDNA